MSRASAELAAADVGAGRSIQIKSQPGLGRVAIASRNFSVGELVLEEAPLMTWSVGQTDLDYHSNFLRAYTEASQADRAAVLEMAHPELESTSKRMEALRLVAASIGLQFMLETNLALKLLAIRETNAHEYYGAAEHNFFDLAPQVALFRLGSKVAHSCLPNVMYSSKNKNGQLRYIAIRPIRTGDRVTCSYIGNIWGTPTYERRLRLRDRYAFVCRCERCDNVDLTRAVRCPRDNCSRVAMPNDASWSCANCGTLTSVEGDAIARRERDIIASARMVATSMRAGAGRLEPAFLRILARRATDALSPTHFTAINASMELATLLVVSSQHSSRADCAESAAVEGYKAVALCECAAAGCAGCTENSHAALYECNEIAFSATNALLRFMKLARKHAPPELSTRAIKYIPVHESIYGKDNDHVSAIRAAFMTRQSCLDSRTPMICVSRNPCRSHDTSCTSSTRGKLIYLKPDVPSK